MVELSLAETVANLRPAADKSVEQVLMTPESLRLQAVLLRQMIPEQAKVASLGDDDHLTILLGLTMQMDIAVYEYDDRIIDSLRTAAASYGIRNYSVVKHDLAQPLPPSDNGKFDVCLSNPPYSSKNDAFGIKVWLSRSLQLLKPGGLGLVVIPIEERLPWSMKNMATIQSYLAKIGCPIIRVEKDVHAYYAANDPGLMSSNIWYRPTLDPAEDCLIGTVRPRSSLYR